MFQGSLGKINFKLSFFLINFHLFSFWKPQHKKWWKTKMKHLDKISLYWESDCGSIGRTSTLTLKDFNLKNFGSNWNYWKTQVQLLPVTFFEIVKESMIWYQDFDKNFHWINSSIVFNTTLQAYLLKEMRMALIIREEKGNHGGIRNSI